MTVNVEEYDLTRECWLAGQISDRQMHDIMARDELFRIYVFEALKRPHGEPAE